MKFPTFFFHDDSPPLRDLMPLLVLIAVMVLIELLLVCSDYGLFGPARWRGLAYQYGGFWAGLLFDWQPNYTGQPVTMFASYSFLHGGMKHLATNMVALFVLGQLVLMRIGTRGFAIIYISTALFGALAFGLISKALQPMVGASGALFGLATALLYFDFHDRFRQARSVIPILLIIIGLVVMNVVMWYSLKGQIAGESHLGGGVAGWITAYFWARAYPEER